MADVQTFDEGNTSGAFRTVNYAYGQEGETLGVSGATEPVTYQYDALYRLTSLADGGGHATRYFYNAAGYLYQTAYPLSGATTAPLSAGSADTVTYTGYDGAGDVTARVDGNGTTTAYTYADPESLLTNIHYTLPASPPTYISPLADTSYAYDVYGRRHTMTDATGTQTYTYDDDDATLTRAFAYTGLPTRTVSYAYDPDGSRQSMTLTAVSGSFSYSYDNAGRETGLTNPFGETTTWAYLNNNWLASQSLAASGITGAVSASFTYDARGQVTDLTNRQAPTTLSDFAAPTSGGFDGAGDRLKVTATQPAQPSYGGATTYAYDGRDELTREASARTGGLHGHAALRRGDDRHHHRAGQPDDPARRGDPLLQRRQPGRREHLRRGRQPGDVQRRVPEFDPEGRLTAFGSAEMDGWTGDGLRGWSGPGAFRGATSSPTGTRCWRRWARPARWGR